MKLLGFIKDNRAACFFYFKCNFDIKNYIQKKDDNPDLYII